MKKIQFKYLLLILIINFATNILGSCNIDGNSINISSLKSSKNILSNRKEEVTNRTLEYDEVKNLLIRFHVIANSDTNEDQKLKLKVKNEVIKYLYPYLSNSSSLEESRKIIINNKEEVEEISRKVIKDNNYNYDVKLELSRENFPEKLYGNIVLPQGNYEAFRIIIGSGQGKNWWCVMFPPLCFVDESKAEVEYEKTEKNLEKAKKEEVLNVDDESKEENEKKIEYKFKFIEILKDLF